MGRQVWSVLVVDDDEEIRDLLQVILGLHPFFEVVGWAADGEQGAALAAHLQPSAVVLDLHMPGLDGLDALAAIRSRAPESRIVVLSAYPDPFTLLDVVAQGADAYLDKNRSFAELVPTLVALCAPPLLSGERVLAGSGAGA